MNSKATSTRPGSVQDGRTVSGTIRKADGTPVPGLVVAAFSKSLRSESPLGSAVSGTDGSYRISYPSGTPATNVLARAYQPGTKIRRRGQPAGVVVAESQLRYNAAARLTVDLVVGNEPYRGPSEFATIASAVTAVAGPLPIAQLDESANQRDISFVASQTGHDVATVAMTVKAHRLNALVGVAPELLYGMMRAGAPIELAPLLALSPSAQEQALRSAIARNHISAQQDTDVAAALQALRQASVRYALDKPSEGRGSLGGLLSLALPKGPLQSTFLQAYANHSGSAPDFWRSLAAADKRLGDPRTVARLQQTLQLGALTANSPRLVKTLLDTAANDTAWSMRNLAGFTRRQWSDLIMKSGGAASVPALIAGAGDAERVAAYAAKLQTIVDSAFPTAALLTGAAAAGGATARDLQAFMHDAPGFDIGRNHVGTYLAAHPEVLHDVAQPEQLRARLDTLQRLYRLTPHLPEMQALSDQGVRSGRQVAAMGFNTFAAKFAPTLGFARSKEIYANASHVSSIALALVSNYAPLFDNTAVGVVLPPPVTVPGVPDWQSLFGSPDLCSCSACRAVDSPAAYLVDLLQFLAQRNLAVPSGAGTVLQTALAYLYQRRPDLGEIELNCDNTNVALPYIDLVDELLENAIAPSIDWTQPITGAERALLQTTGTADERSISPEHVDAAAYTLLAGRSYPWSLPFDLPFAQARGYLGILKVRRDDLMATLFAAPPPAELVDPEIAREALGLTPGGRDAIVGAGPATTADYWNETGNPNYLTDLSSVATFLDRSALTFAELQQLSRTAYVGRNGSFAIVYDAQCSIANSTLSGVDETALRRAHRFVRLWRAIGWSMRDLDRATVAFGIDDIDGAFITHLAQVVRIVRATGLSVAEVLNWFARLDTLADFDGTPSLYAGTFQNRTVFPLAPGQTDPFALNAAGSELAASGHFGDPGVLDTMLAGLQMSAADFALLTDGTALEAALGLHAPVLPTSSLNMASLSVLARYASFARAAKLTIPELLALLAISGLTPFDAAHPHQAVVALREVATIRASGFTIATLDLVLRGAEAPGAAAARLQSRQNALRFLRDALARCARDSATLTDPTGDALGARLATILRPADLARAKAIIAGTSAESPAAQSAFIAAQFSSAPSPAVFIRDVANAQQQLVGAAALTQPADRYAYVLRLLAAYLAQNAALAQSLTNPLKLDATVVDPLLDMLHEAGVSARTAFLQPAFVASDPKHAPDPTAFARQYALYDLLGNAAQILARFAVTPLQLGWLRAYGPGVGWLDLDSLPGAALQSAAPLYAAWRRLVDLFALRDALPSGEQLLDAVFAQARGGVPFATFTADLATATGWNQTDLAYALGPHGFGFASLAPFADERALVRLNAAFGLFLRLGASAQQAFSWAAGTLGLGDADAVKHTVKAQYSPATWLSVAKPVADDLRQRSRDALVAYLLAHPATFGAAAGATPSDLYNYFLIDPEMGSCMDTSRIKQAIGSVQLFVQRCMMGLEAAHIPSPPEAKDWHQLWSWMSSYVVWQANRQVFLYPENYLEPELRAKKSPFFATLEQDLMKSDLSKDAAETAFHAYLESLDEVARLDIRASYHQLEVDSDGNPIVDVLHVVGRTYGFQKTYYYRTRVDGTYWTAWQKIDADIAGDQLLIVVYERRIRLVWPVFTTVASPNQTTPAAAQGVTGQSPSQHIEIQLGWTDYNAKTRKWAKRKQTARSVSSDLANPSDHLFRWNIQAGSLAVWFEQTSPSTQLCYPLDDGWGDVSTWCDSWPFQIEPCFVFDGPTVDARIDDVMDWGVTAPAGSASSGTMWQATGTALSLFDDSAASGSVPVLGTASSFEVVPPPPLAAQAGTDPLFYQDRARTFFVEPDDQLVPVWPWLDLEAVDVGAIDHLIDQYFVMQPPAIVVDPGYPGPDPNPIDPVMDEPSYAYVSRSLASDATIGAMPGVGAALGASTATVALRSEVRTRSATLGRAAAPSDARRPALELMAAHVGSTLDTTLDRTPAIVEAAPLLSYSTGLALGEAKSQYAAGILSQGASFSDVMFPWWVHKRFYRFSTHQHPYVRSFISALNRDGIDGLLQRTVQVDSHGDYFQATYAPQDDVDTPYPLDDVDFSYDGAYSLYNWELFFHAPTLIAQRLGANLKFDDARTWYQYIFNPTDFSANPVPQRYWQTRPFYEATAADYASQQIQQLLTDMANGTSSQLDLQVREWRRNPFDPDIIAQMRPVAYQKSTVMKYLDNLIAWGDSLFRRDTIESINQAEQLYILAAEILGPRPQQMTRDESAAFQTYNQLAPHLDSFSEALVSLETFANPPPAQGSAQTDPIVTLTPCLYFCVPQNQTLLGYWDTIDDRLSKIRHCENIAGIVQQLPLFEPPINPMLLVGAVAGGVDISTALAQSAMALPNYRFSVMVERALALAADVRMLGSALLNALEKSDVEALATLRSSEELSLLSALRAAKALRVQEAQSSIDALVQQQLLTQARLNHYTGLTFMNPAEAMHLQLSAEAALLGAAGGAMDALGLVDAHAARSRHRHRRVRRQPDRHALVRRREHRRRLRSAGSHDADRIGADQRGRGRGRDAGELPAPPGGLEPPDQLGHDRAQADHRPARGGELPAAGRSGGRRRARRPGRQRPGIRRSPARQVHQPRSLRLDGRADLERLLRRLPAGLRPGQKGRTLLRLRARAPGQQLHHLRLLGQPAAGALRRRPARLGPAPDAGFVPGPEPARVRAHQADLAGQPGSRAARAAARDRRLRHPAAGDAVRPRLPGTLLAPHQERRADGSLRGRALHEPQRDPDAGLEQRSHDHLGLTAVRPHRPRRSALRRWSRSHRLDRDQHRHQRLGPLRAGLPRRAVRAVRGRGSDQHLAPRHAASLQSVRLRDRHRRDRAAAVHGARRPRHPRYGRLGGGSGGDRRARRAALQRGRRVRDGLVRLPQPGARRGGGSGVRDRSEREPLPLLRAGDDDRDRLDRRLRRRCGAVFARARTAGHRTRQPARLRRRHLAQPRRGREVLRQHGHHGGCTRHLVRQAQEAERADVPLPAGGRHQHAAVHRALHHELRAAGRARHRSPAASRKKSGNASTEPFHRSSSTSANSAMSLRSVASTRNSIAPSRSRCSVCASLDGTSDVDVPGARVGRDGFEVTVFGQDGGGRFRAPARQARKAVGSITDQRQIVGDAGRRDAELRHDAGFVEDGARSPVQLDDAGPAHALREIFVRRADHDALDARVGGSGRRRGRQRVVGLELDHRPHDDPRRGQRLFEQRELREQIGLDALARLVSRPQAVAERFDDVIGRHPDVRRPTPEQGPDRGEDAADGGDLAPLRIAPRRERIIVAKQLVRAVHDMNDHAVALAAQRQRGPGDRVDHGVAAEQRREVGDDAAQVGVVHAGAALGLAQRLVVLERVGVGAAAAVDHDPGSSVARQLAERQRHAAQHQVRPVAGGVVRVHQARRGCAGHVDDRDLPSALGVARRRDALRRLEQVVPRRARPLEAVRAVGGVAVGHRVAAGVDHVPQRTVGGEDLELAGRAVEDEVDHVLLLTPASRACARSRGSSSGCSRNGSRPCSQTLLLSIRIEPTGIVTYSIARAASRSTRTGRAGTALRPGCAGGRTGPRSACQAVVPIEEDRPLADLRLGVVAPLLLARVAGRRQLEAQRRAAERARREARSASGQSSRCSRIERPPAALRSSVLAKASQSVVSAGAAAPSVCSAKVR